MRKQILRFSLIVALSGLAAAANAQQIVVWQDNFESVELGSNSGDGSYGVVAWQYASPGYGNPLVVITNNNLLGANMHNCAFIFDTTDTIGGAPLNFGWRTDSLPATDNTNSSLRAYTLEFDIAVQGMSLDSLGGYVGPSYGLFGNNGGMYFGDGAQPPSVPVSFFPAAGTGYQHVSVSLKDWASTHANLLPPTDATLAFFIGFYIAGATYAGPVEIDLSNMRLLMDTNPPALPPPTLAVLPAKPGLRIFAMDHTATWNQEGFGTADTSQSWVGVATKDNPVSYSITIGDFDTVNNYTLFAQFVQNGNPGDPYGVYNGQNALVWQIARQDSGFTTRIDWKTNSPASGQPNNVLSLTTASTNGQGTWTLSFTNDTDGMILAPDGSSNFFSLPNDPAWLASFANPLIIDFGTAPNSSAGYGQWITLSKIAISNVVDGTEYDDFTQDDSLNTSLWNPGFSYNGPSAVIHVSTNTPLWVNWTLPDEGFGLATKADLNSSTPWYTPNYYGNGTWTNTAPTQMGTELKWTLIPKGCLPTADGTPGGTPAPTAFFRLSKPAPAQ